MSALLICRVGFHIVRACLFVSAREHSFFVVSHEHGKESRGRLPFGPSAGAGGQTPRTPLLNAVVWPYAGGEVVLQSYNAALCFAALQHCSDGLLVFSNRASSSSCSSMKTGRES